MSFAARRPETEVAAKATRRKFTAEYKSRIVREAATCIERGALGALLRREGLYSSHLVKWRAEFERGGTNALAGKRRGPKAKVVDPRDKRIAELEREIAKSKRRLERAEALIEAQKKLSQILGIALPSEPEESE